MKFVFDRDAMIKEIAVAQDIITNKNAISILSNILLIAKDNKLTIKATDSVVKFTTVLPVEIETEGSTTIFCDKFFTIINAMPAGDVEFIQEDIVVTIRSTIKKIQFTLKSQVSDKFPEFGTTENIPFFELNAKEFKEMIRHTIITVSTDASPTRINMTGVYFTKEGDSIKMVGTDSKNLSYASKIAVNVPDFQPSIVPVKILNCILKNAPDEGNIEVAVINKSIYAKFGTMEFSSVLISGSYPDYKRIISTEFSNSIQVNKKDLSEALKRITIMVMKESYLIFKFNSGVLKIMSLDDSMGNAYEEIPCRYDGDEIVLNMKINSLDPIKIIEKEDVVFNMNVDENGEVSRAVLLRPEPASDYFHLMMPIRL